MSAVLDRIKSVRETLFTGPILGKFGGSGQLFNLQNFNLQGLLGGQGIRAMTATKLASALQVAPPAATSSLPVIDTLREKALAFRPAPSAPAPTQKQAFPTPAIVPPTKAQFG